MTPILTNDIQAPKRTRRRPALACLECRKRKIKCDRNRPCNKCTGSGSPTCTYALSPQSRPRVVARQEHSSEAEVHPNIEVHNPAIQQRNSQTHRVPTQSFPTPISSTQAISPLAYSNRSEQSNATATDDTSEKFTDLQNHENRFINRLADKEVPVTASTLRGMVSKSRLFGPSHWSNTYVQFDFLSDIVRGNTRLLSVADVESISRSFAVIGKCKALAQAQKSKRPDQVLPWPELLDSIPSRNIADTLVDNYFRVFESVYRILHIPSFRAEYEEYWNNRPEWYKCEPSGRGFVMQLLLVLALGYCLYPKSQSNANALGSIAQQWIYSVIDWTWGPIEKDRLTLSGLQVQCLTHLARLVHNIGANQTCISVNTILDTAIFMGLHRDPVHFLHMTTFTAEMRRRLWATIIEMVIQSEIGTGRCVRLSTDDFDTEAPSNLNDDDLSATSTGLVQPKPTLEFTQASLQIVLAESWQVRHETVRAINNIRSEPAYDEVLQLNTKLMASYRQSLKVLKADGSPPISALDVRRSTACDRNLYESFFRRFLLSLHRPFAFKARKDPRYYFSRKMVLESSLFVLNPETDDDYNSIISFAMEMFREIPSHAGTSLCFEVLCQLEEEQASMTLSQPNPQREQLKAGIKYARDLLERRLEQADFSIKGVVFISMALAHIEAIETGTEPQAAIIEAARTSPLRCYELLKTRTDTIRTPQSHRDHDTFLAGTGEAMIVNSQLQNLDFDILEGTGLSDFDFGPTWLFPGWAQTVT